MIDAMRRKVFYEDRSAFVAPATSRVITRMRDVLIVELIAKPSSTFGPDAICASLRFAFHSCIHLVRKMGQGKNELEPFSTPQGFPDYSSSAVDTGTWLAYKLWDSLLCRLCFFGMLCLLYEQVVQFRCVSPLSRVQFTSLCCVVNFCSHRIVV